MRYRDENNHFISKAKAAERGWSDGDGNPTDAYEEELARREQVKSGVVGPDEAQLDEDAPEVGAERPHYAGIPSPYDLERRSG